MDMMDASAKFTRGGIRNDDICDELVLSKEGMRFDQRERENEARKREQEELMREAEAALA